MKLEHHYIIGSPTGKMHSPSCFCDFCCPAACYMPHSALCACTANIFYWNELDRAENNRNIYGFCESNPACRRLYKECIRLARLHPSLCDCLPCMNIRDQALYSSLSIDDWF